MIARESLVAGGVATPPAFGDLIGRFEFNDFGDTRFFYKKLNSRPRTKSLLIFGHHFSSESFSNNLFSLQTKCCESVRRT